jgi:DNA-binding transcriptional ArsR family regulator
VNWEEKMADEDTNIQPKKLKLDQKKQFHLVLPNGKKEIISLTDQEIETAENWLHLVGKHEIRLDIMNILQIYDEMNITQISQNAEQSKSTVARHLKSMEQDGLLVSRTAKPGEYELGKIPPRLYRRNNKILKVIQYSPTEPPKPSESGKLAEYIQKDIDSYRGHIKQFVTFYEKIELIFKLIESHLQNEEIEIAHELFIKYIEDEITRPRLQMDMRSLSEKYFLKVVEVYNEFLKKLGEVLSLQNTDPDVKAREFTALFAIMPIKDMYDLYREEKLRKKKK